MNASDVFVLMPDEYGGLAVCDLQQLFDQIEDGTSLYDAVGNAAIESTLSIKPKPETLVRLIERTKALNETGDADAFWKPEDGPVRPPVGHEDGGRRGD